MVQHMVGVQPLGACFQSDCVNVRNSGLGKLACFSDEQVLSVLSYLDARDLIRLSSVSKALYCFANHEELWKSLVIEEFEGRFLFQATWKDTFIQMQHFQQAKAHPHPSDTPPSELAPGAQGSSLTGNKRTRKHTEVAPRQEKRLKIANFYSDLLYQSHLCATSEIDARWLQGDNLLRVNAATLSREAFQHQYEKPNIPVVLTGGKEFSSARKKWNFEFLRQKLLGRSIIAGDMEMQAEDFFMYLQRQNDDSPLYLFDQHFAERSPALAEDYTTPAVFPQPFGNTDVSTIKDSEKLQDKNVDLFALLGDKRPNFRWLIVGGARSGSTFHVDPNGTSAWNACICGRKLWCDAHFSFRALTGCRLPPVAVTVGRHEPVFTCRVMFPPGPPPPGVHVSEDGASVATPVCPIEWFLTFYEECCELYGQPEDTFIPTDSQNHSSGDLHSHVDKNNSFFGHSQCSEDASILEDARQESSEGQAHKRERPKWYHGVVGPGEVMFVPSGWWHCVLNLDGFCAAITQNFVSQCNLPAVLRVLRSRNVELISGCPEHLRTQLYDVLVCELESHYPGLLAALDGYNSNNCVNSNNGKGLSELFASAQPASSSLPDNALVGVSTSDGQCTGLLPSFGQTCRTENGEVGVGVSASQQFSFKFSFGE